MEKRLGKLFTVTVDRPLGSRHPQHAEIVYPINYGFIKGVMAADGEEQDAYILGVNHPVVEYRGRLIAIVHRKNDIETKWVISNVDFTKEEIVEQLHFMEQYFNSEIVMADGEE